MLLWPPAAAAPLTLLLLPLQLLLPIELRQLSPYVYAQVLSHTFFYVAGTTSEQHSTLSCTACHP
jgi:hypothetical protein